MPDIIQDRLNTLLKGAGTVFIGTILGNVLGFLIMILIVRIISPAEFGVYSLAIVICGIFIQIAMLGINEGSARFVAYYRGKDQEPEMHQVVILSVQLTLAAGIIIAILVFFSAGFIADTLLHEPGLTVPLQVMACTIPFSVLTTIFLSITRGLELINPGIFFQNILRNLLLVLSLFLLVTIGATFAGVLILYLLASILTCVAFLGYMLKRSLVRPVLPPAPVNPGLRRELLTFSLPLMAIGLLTMMISWTDSLMLGYLTNAVDVGLYNAALPLANIITMVLVSVGFLYTPIATGLFATRKEGEMYHIYTASTRWCFIGALPFLLFFTISPGLVLAVFFGREYAVAANVLRILSIGFFINVITGPNYHSLVAIGKPHAIIKTFAVCGALSIGINFLFISWYGLIGAAYASALLMSIATILLSVFLYRYSGIHPLNRNYGKLVLALGILFLVTAYWYPAISSLALFPYILVVIAMMMFYLGLLAVLHCFESYDILILRNTLAFFVAKIRR
jgi:O-antigen/teichoic acid export membrane protein